MNCANCTDEALYVYQGPGSPKIAYCTKCLPSFLREQAKAGTLQTTDIFDSLREQVTARLLPEEVTEDPAEPSEDNDEEQAAVEPTPKRRSRKTLD